MCLPILLASVHQAHLCRSPSIPVQWHVMQWFTKIQQQAAEAAEMLISSEAAEKARQLAVQATQHATVLAQQATVKAQVRCSRAVIALGAV